MKSNSETNAAPYAALIGVQIFFGSLPVVAKPILQIVPALSMVGFRVGITAAVLAAVQIVRGRFFLKFNSDYAKLALLSLFGVTFNQILFISGLARTKAANTSLLAATIPIFTLAVASVLGFERLRLLKLAGIILAALGVLVIIDPRSASFSSETTLGDLLVVGNSLSYGIYVATSKSVVTRNGAIRSVMWIFIFASIVCVPLGGYILSSAPLEGATTATWLAVLYIALGGTTAPYLLNAWALARVNPSTVAIFVYLQPVIGFLLAVFFLGENIGPSFIVAALLIFAGVFLVTRRFTTADTHVSVPPAV